MPKLWCGMRKRLAKKQLGYSWHKLQFGRTLRPGDLISTCKGWNEIVKEAHPEYRSSGRSTGRIVVDFGILTTAGGSCSLIHCCAYPTETRQQIVDYWLSKDDPEQQQWYERWSGGQKWEDSSWGKITIALKQGQEVFDKDGLFLGI